MDSQKNKNQSDPNTQLSLFKTLEDSTLPPEKLAKKLLSQIYMGPEGAQANISHHFRSSLKTLKQTKRGQHIIDSLFKVSAFYGKSALVYALLRDNLDIKDSLKTTTIIKSKSAPQKAVAKEIFLQLTKETQDKLIQNLKKKGNSSLLEILNSR